MKVPNADRAIIATDKLTGYLLNVSHKRGGPKARLLLSVGYRSDHSQSLESDLRSQHLLLDVSRTHENAYDAVSGVSEEGYSVEFFDMTGNTMAVVTLPASALRLPTPADRPAVRALSA